ncbi:hypothetical protein [Streptomyces vinaceus]|uniref:hypothetical protein n=1 Tax=Streptomyces vinaceus TaxID=1960 RepID=UPI0038280A5E
MIDHSFCHSSGGGPTTSAGCSSHPTAGFVLDLRDAFVSTISFVKDSVLAGVTAYPADGEMRLNCSDSVAAAAADALMGAIAMAPATEIEPTIKLVARISFESTSRREIQKANIDRGIPGAANCLLMFENR